MTANNQGRVLMVAFLALVAGALAMGASPVFVRTSGIGPFTSAFWRVALALPLLALWAWADSRRHGAMPSDPTRRRAVILAGLFFAGDLIFWHLAIMNTTMANATLMSCLAPVWVLLLSGIAIGEPVPPRSFLGLFLCLAGAAMLIGSSHATDPGRILGDFYGVVTSVFFGLYFLALRTARRGLPAGNIAFSSSLVTAAVLLVAAILSGEAFLPQSPGGFASLLALGVVSHAGGQGMLAFALGALSAAFSSLVIFLEAVAAAVLGYIFFDEKLGAMQLGGGLLVLVGVWIARPRGQAPEAAASDGAPPTNRPLSG